MRAAKAKLKQRTPLGSTDMIAGLHAALTKFSESSEKPRAVVYIGDGLSRANLFGDPEIQELVKQLVARRVSVSSFVIGPERNVAFLAVLANQTGGMIFIDNDDEGHLRQPGRDWPKRFRIRCCGRRTCDFHRGSSNIILRWFRRCEPTATPSHWQAGIARSATALDDRGSQRQIDRLVVGFGGRAIE